MPSKFRITDDIEFLGPAARRSNIEGPLQEEMVHFNDDFTNVTLESNVWASDTTGTTGPATIAISEVAGGECLITTGTADNDSCSMATAIIYSGSKRSICEARILITDVSGTAVFVGFSDAKDEANASIAIHYPDDSLTTVATNAAGFVIDADHSTSSIMCASVKADVDTTPVDSAVDWADGEAKTLRIEIDADGNATFFMDGSAVGYIANAVTAATLQCFTVQALTRANDGANTVRVKHVDVWCVRT